MGGKNNHCSPYLGGMQARYFSGTHPAGASLDRCRVVQPSTCGSYPRAVLLKAVWNNKMRNPIETYAACC